MEEKELIKDIRWQFSKGKSRAEVTRNLQKRGLKLEFVDSLISHAKKPKRIIRRIIYGLFIFIFMWFGVYGMFFYHNTEEIIYEPNWILNTSDINLEESLSLEITPDLISLFVSELGATKLKRNPLTLKRPIINFKISDKEFYTIIDKRIETFEGNNNEADILITSYEINIVKIFSSENTKETIKSSFIEGDIKIDKINSERDLFMKGYLSLYNGLD